MSFAKTIIAGAPVTTTHTTNQRTSDYHVAADRYGLVWTSTILAAGDVIHAYFSNPPYSSWTDDGVIYTPATPSNSFTWSQIMTLFQGFRPVLGVRLIEVGIARWRFFIRNNRTATWAPLGTITQGTNSSTWEQSRLFFNPANPAEWLFLGLMFESVRYKVGWSLSTDTGATFSALTSFIAPQNLNSTFSDSGLYDFVQGTGSNPTIYGVLVYNSISPTIYRLRYVEITDAWSGAPTITISDIVATNFTSNDAPFKLSLGLDRTTGDLHLAYLRVPSSTNRRMMYRTKPAAGSWSAEELVGSAGGNHESCAMQVDIAGLLQIITSGAGTGTFAQVNILRYTGSAGAWSAFEEILDEAADHRNISIMKDPQWSFGTPEAGMMCVYFDDTNDDFNAIVENTFSVSSSKSSVIGAGS